jgi:hypothetical protein
MEFGDVTVYGGGRNPASRVPIPNGFAEPVWAKIAPAT